MYMYIKSKLIGKSLAYREEKSLQNLLPMVSYLFSLKGAYQNISWK